MKRGLLIVVLASLCLVAGCKVDQEAEVRTYRKVVDMPATRPADIGIGQMTLLRALQSANQQNERLSIEGENYLQAIINRKRALAGFLPTANLTGSYGLDENVGAGQQNHALDAAAVGNINLFNGFSDQARLRVADLTIQQRNYLLQDVQEGLLTDVVRAYYAVLRNEQLVKVLENTADLQQQRVDDIHARREAGVARPLDVAQSEAQASATRVTLIDARNAVANARSALTLLTGLEMGGVALSEVDPLTAADDDAPEIERLAVSQRQDLLAAGKARDAARQGVEAAVGQYYPSLSLNLQAFLYRETVPSDRDWQSLLQMNLPIFTAGKIEADVRQAWSQFRQAALFESLLRRQVLSDVRVARENLESSRKRLTELTVQVTAARQAVEQSEQSYSAGLATNLERLASQDQLLNASLGQTSEYYNRRLAYAELLHAAGELRSRIAKELSPTTAPAAAAATSPATGLIPPR
jgi:outer membrane protein TolC